MSPAKQLQGQSDKSFADAAQTAVAEITELPDDQQVSYKVVDASVTVGGLTGATTYEVVLELK